MKTISITGAESFIGQHLAKALLALDGIEIRALVFDDREIKGLRHEKIIVIKGDLLHKGSLDDFIARDGTVINLAYLWGRSKGDNLQALINLGEAFLKAGARRLVHCSTAVVSGRSPEQRIDEETVCQPVNDYETTKYAMETFLFDELKEVPEIAILRPTAVFGPQGKNLLKLADGLCHGSRLAAYLKSCLFDERRMNLVALDNVIAALVFLATVERPITREVFIVSDDEYPQNNYRSIEKYLMKCFGCQDYVVPRFKLPLPLLRKLLALAGKGSVDPARTYDGGKLVRFGFRKPVGFEAGLDKFATWYKKEHGLS